MDDVQPRYLLDSNIAIYLLDGKAPEAARRLQTCAAGEVVTSSICLAEMRVKLEPRHEDGLRKMLTVVGVLDFDLKAAEVYGRLPFKRHSFDRLIAAHALSLGLTVITANTSDFADVPGLRVENWIAA